MQLTIKMKKMKIVLVIHKIPKQNQIILKNLHIKIPHIIRKKNQIKQEKFQIMRVKVKTKVEIKAKMKIKAKLKVKVKAMSEASKKIMQRMKMEMGKMRLEMKMTRIVKIFLQKYLNRKINQENQILQKNSKQK